MSANVSLPVHLEGKWGIWVEGKETKVQGHVLLQDSGEKNEERGSLCPWSGTCILITRLWLTFVFKFLGYAKETLIQDPSHLYQFWWCISCWHVRSAKIFHRWWKYHENCCNTFITATFLMKGLNRNKTKESWRRAGFGVRQNGRCGSAPQQAGSLAPLFEAPGLFKIKRKNQKNLRCGEYKWV